MSHIRYKTKYNVEVEYGKIEERIVYVDYNNSIDIATFYDEDGEKLFVVQDTVDNNLIDAIIRLYEQNPLTNNSVEYMTKDDLEKCKL